MKVKPVSSLLVGVVHLPPLPGSPLSRLSAMEIARQCAADVRVLEDAGFDAVIIENYGDAPFLRGPVPAVTVSAMTAAAVAARDACPSFMRCVNVLRNDAAAALSIASVTGASAIRVNVHAGARVTDQGIIEADAAATLRLRRLLSAESVQIWADVDVKHSAPLAAVPLEQEVSDVIHRGHADAVLVTGDGTGAMVDLEKLARVKKAASGARVLVASGATIASLGTLAGKCDGVIVGSALRASGVAGGRIDRARAKRFAAAFRKFF